jgi:menaquinone-dependent protoporphyrinogen IX oxidase
MKGIIIYKGKYRATERYAHWLSEETGFPVIVADKFNASDLSTYDTVILGTSVYIGKLRISKWLKKNWYALLNKKLHLFLVAGTPPDQKEKLTGYVRDGVPKAIFNELSLTFLPGKLFVNELSTWDRFLLRMGSKLEERKDPSKKFPVDYDHVKKENLEPLIDQLIPLETYAAR